MSLLDRSNFGDNIAILYFTYYGRIAWRFEHLQLCISNLRRGFESGLSSGSPEGGFRCAIYVIVFSICSGEKLLPLLKEIDYFLHLLGSYNHVVARNYMLNFRETVSNLIDRGNATDIEAKASFSSMSESPILVQKAIRMYWLGYTERCNHFIEKSLEMIGQSGEYMSYLMKFYQCKNTQYTCMMLCRNESSLSPCIFLSSFSSITSLHYRSKLT